MPQNQLWYKDQRKPVMTTAQKQGMVVLHKNVSFRPEIVLMLSLSFPWCRASRLISGLVGLLAITACEPQTITSAQQSRLAVTASLPAVKSADKSDSRASIRITSEQAPTPSRPVLLERKPKVPPKASSEMAVSKPATLDEAPTLIAVAPPPELSSPPPKPVEDPVATSVLDSIIWQIQTSRPKTPAVPKETVIPSSDPTLKADALEAAFALLSGRAKTIPEPSFRLPPKPSQSVRVGVMVPLTGDYAHLGTEIRHGVELAFFKIGNPSVELLFFDTKGGETAAAAAAAAVLADVDLLIGPLFSGSVQAVQAEIGGADLPMLTLSNNIEVANANQWVIGYLPEQQLDGLLGHAITIGKRDFAVIGQDTAFGRRLMAHTSQRLADFGIRAKAERMLTPDELNDENSLKDAIRRFSRYVRTPKNRALPKSPFDVVVFAGDPGFALRTAPVLAYYDLGPDRALYLGNALWGQPQVLNEPSLQGGLFTSRPTSLDREFDRNWGEIWNQPAGLLSRLGYDAMAIAGALAREDRAKWGKQLVSNTGFRGFSGAFRLLPNGHNVRAFEVRQISDGGSTVIKPAPDKI